MTTDSAFTWGPGGAKMTPERIASERKIAQAMMQRGMDYSPIRSPWQGAARVAEAMMGGYDYSRADQAEKANMTADKEMIAKLLGGEASVPSAQSISPAIPPVMPPAVSPASGVPVSADKWKIYANDEPSPLDPPSGSDRDMAVRTVLAEAGNQPPVGQLAVANVIRKRAINGGFGGDTIPGVITAKNQFEPWNTQAGRQRMAGYNPNSPAYQQAGAMVDQAYAGANDPTNGATNFYAPKAQAALGRQPPRWDNGTGRDIFDHRFFGGVPGDAALPPNAQLAQGPAPAATTSAAAPSAGGLSGVNPALLQALTSPYSSEGTKKIAGIILQQKLQGDAVTTVDLGTTIAVMDKRGNVVKTIPKSEKATYQTTPDGDILAMDPTGRAAPKVVYQATPKPISVPEDSRLWDPRTRTFIGGDGPAPATSVPGPGGKSIPIPEGLSSKDRKEFTKSITSINADAAGGKKTEVQAKDEKFANKMELAEANISEIDIPNSGWRGPGGATGRFLEGSGWVPGSATAGNYLQTNDYQKFKQARDNFITALLRDESGAAIGIPEFVRYEKELFPQPGDGPDVIKQKSEARRVAIEGMKKGAGPGYKSPTPAVAAGNAPAGVDVKVWAAMTPAERALWK